MKIKTAEHERQNRGDTDKTEANKAVAGITADLAAAMKETVIMIKVDLIFAPVSQELQSKMQGLAKSLYEHIQRNMEWKMLGDHGIESFKKLFSDLYLVCQDAVREMAEVSDLQPDELDGTKKDTFDQVCEGYKEWLE